jgi:uncharacterized protein
MRLTAQEQASIHNEIVKKDPQAQIYLYGSRTQDHLMGGDIDLLVISETLSFSDKVDILIAIKDQIGDQKIDLSIKSEKDVKSDPFWQKILANATLLAQPIKPTGHDTNS